MKKLILLSSVFLLSCATFATTQTDTTLQKTEELVDSVIPDSASLTFKEVYSDIKSGIGALASALEVGAEHVYTILVRQQIAVSIYYSSMLFIGMVLIVMGCNSISKSAWGDPTHYTDDEKDSKYYKGYAFNRYAIFSILFNFIGIIILFIGLINIDLIVNGFVNPEYGAIKEILAITFK